ncbi:metal ABC transporter permease [candidate division KSB1 bacterium]|nr:metal ABC transporter permease [candidate division KSB1 bacterium]
MLTLPFVQRALLAATLMALTGGLLSFFVVQRKLAFMGHGIAHSMIAGVAIGLVFDLPVVWPALAVALICAAGIGWVARNAKVSEDSAIGILLSAALAGGLLLISLRRGFLTHLESYLFGSIVAVMPGDLLVLGLLAAVTIGILGKYWRIISFYAFDPEGAQVAGYPVELFRYALLVLLAVTIAVVMKIVGILLVGAFLVIPAAAAAYWSPRAISVVLISAGIALVCAVGGMFAAIAFNLAAGPAIVAALVAGFAVSRLVGRYR